MSKSRLDDTRRTWVGQLLIKLFPAQWLREQAKTSGWIQRQRELDPVAFFWTLVLGFAVGKERTLAGLQRIYERETRSKIQRSSFYDRFTASLVNFLKTALDRALLDALEESGAALKEKLSHFKDLLMTDSTVIRLHRKLSDVYKACRTNHTQAAAKLHLVLNVLKASPSRIRITSERTNDRAPWRRVGPWIAGHLLMFDLGYFGYRLFDLIDRNLGYFLSRLKDNTNPLITSVLSVHRGRARKLSGMRLQDALKGLHRQVLDCIVEVSFERRSYGGKRTTVTRKFRVVAVFNPEKQRYHLYITNIPVEWFNAEEVASIYRLRWQVELLFKELRSQFRLDQLPSEKLYVVEALIYAAIIVLIVCRRLYQVSRRKAGGRRMTAMRWAIILATHATDLLQMVLRLCGVKRGKMKLEDLMVAQAIDPNVGRTLALDKVVSP